MIPTFCSHLLIACLLGFPLISLCLSNIALPIACQLALSFIIGTALISWWSFILLCFHLPINLLTILLPLAFFSITLYAYGQNKIKNSLSINLAHNDGPSLSFLLQGLICLFVGFQIFYSISLSIMMPFYTWDGIFAIALKAKYLYTLGDINGLQFFKTNASYPLLVELTMVWMAILNGGWNEQAIKLIFPFMAICFCCLHYYFLRTFVNRSIALIGLGLLCASGFFVYHASIEYRAIFFMLYNILPIFCLCLWQKHPINGLLILGGVIAGFGAFTKLEGLGHLLIYTLLIIYTLYQQRTSLSTMAKNVGLFILPAVLIIMPFNILKYTWHINPMEGRLSAEALSLQHIIERIFTIGMKLSNELFFSGNWNMLWLILVLAIPLRPKKNQAFNSLGLALLSYFGLYIFLGVFTAVFDGLFGWQSQLNISRAILHFYPLVPLLITLILAEPLARLLSNQVPSQKL